VTDDGSLVISTWNPETPGQETMDVFVIRTDRRAPVKHVRIAFPKGVEASEVAYSNDGQRVAILSVAGEPDPLRRFLRGMRLGEAATSQIWTAELGSGRWASLGTAHFDGLTEGMGHLRWVPGDRALSYRCGDALYAVPVPRPPRR
jgi:hypothetical protein